MYIKYIKIYADKEFEESFSPNIFLNDICSLSCCQEFLVANLFKGRVMGSDL